MNNNLWFKNVVLSCVVSYKINVDVETGDFLVIVSLTNGDSITWRFNKLIDAEDCAQQLKTAVNNWYFGLLN